MKRTPFPTLFWTGNIIEVLERFAYYGLYLGFSIFATTSFDGGGLGWSEGRLGAVQTLFLFLSYSVPLVSGVMADRYGFKKMLILSYLLYLPGFVFLLFTRSYLLILLVMCLIAVAAGVFKPLIAGTVRLTTDQTNRTLGFGIFYLMVNVGAFFGPLTAGALRTQHWNYAFLASAVCIVLMMLVTIPFYRDPWAVEKNPQKRMPLGRHLKEILPFLKVPRILVFILIFGLFIEIPFWAFFNIGPMFVDRFVRTDLLYESFSSVLGDTVVGWFTRIDEQGIPRISGESLGHTALYIILFQLLVTRSTERMRSVPVIALGVFVMILGCFGLFFSTGDMPGLMFVGLLLFALGEMTCMPRFEQYLISLLPPEKTGLGGGLLRIPVAIGALSGITLTPIYGLLREEGSPQSVWLVMAAALFTGFLLVTLYDRIFRGSE